MTVCNKNTGSIQRLERDLIKYIAIKICKPIKWFDIDVTSLTYVMNFTFVYIPM
jgi:hypothetical protein